MVDNQKLLTKLHKLNASGVLYEPEDDVLMVKESDDPIDSAEIVGDMIVHFSKENKPVLIEILNATRFLKSFSGGLPKALKEKVFA